MAKTLTQIQQAVKFITADDNVVLTDGFGRRMANRVYRGLAASFPWPELNKKAVLTSPTVVDQENYELTGEDMPNFVDLDYVEVKSLSYDRDTVDSDIFNTDTISSATARYTHKLVNIPPNEFEWNLAGRRDSTDTPLWYKRFNSNRHIIVTADVGTGINKWHSVNNGATWVQTTTANIGDEVRYYAATAAIGTGATEATDTNRIALRPTPSVAGYEIRVVGIEEPTELSGHSSTTVFILSNADDALEYLLSAAWEFRFKRIAMGKVNLERAAKTLSNIFTKQLITTETISGLT
jgi:hypothetical protein